MFYYMLTRDRFPQYAQENFNFIPPSVQVSTVFRNATYVWEESGSNHCPNLTVLIKAFSAV